MPRNAPAVFYASRVAEVGGPVLVLGSAEGGIAWELAARGVEVVGAEPSARMLEAAEGRRASEALEVSGRIRFVCADVRSLRLDRQFAAVLAPHNAFGLLDSLPELEDLIATARHHLGDEAPFLFDVSVAPYAAPAPEQAHMRPVKWMEPPRPVFVPHLRQRRRVTGGEVPSALHRLRLRQFTVPELDQALEAGGFVALERYGDFDGKPYDAGDALAVVVATSSPARR